MNAAPTTRYVNGRVYSPADPTATAILTRDATIAWIGASADAPAADVTIDLGGALITPAFTDAHVHTTDTGIGLTGLDLTGARSAADVLDRLATHAAALPADTIVVGHGWDESSWSRQQPPSAPELDRAAAGRPVYLSQASVHSAVVSSALLHRAPPTAPGYDPIGWLRRDAHHAVRAIAMGSISPARRDLAQRAALRHAAALGIAAVHECGGPGTSGEADFTGVLALGHEDTLPDVYGYWGELGGAAKARDLGAAGAGGDLYADGALGSRTAHLRSPYLDTGDGHAGHGCDDPGHGHAGHGCDDPGHGHAGHGCDDPGHGHYGHGYDDPGHGHYGHGYLTAEHVGAHLIDCAEHRMQGGFHAIGDAAIATVMRGFAIAAATVGIDAIRSARHRVEHAEILDKALIASFVEFGVIASVQPAFDRLWGGEHAMYAQRLGRARSLSSNPIGALAGVGVALAFGSDSPVTPLDPWGTIRAAMTHHNPVSRIGVKAAFAAHTRGGARAVHHDDDGVIAPGAPATFAVWSVPVDAAGPPGRTSLPILTPAAPGEADPDLPTCLRTVVRGTTIFTVEEPS